MDGGSGGLLCDLVDLRAGANCRDQFDTDRGAAIGWSARFETGWRCLW